MDVLSGESNAMRIGWTAPLNSFGSVIARSQSSDCLLDSRRSPRLARDPSGLDCRVKYQQSSQAHTAGLLTAPTRLP
jgi:hypothetical protein